MTFAAASAPPCGGGGPVAALQYQVEGQWRTLTLTCTDLTPLFPGPLDTVAAAEKRPDIAVFGFGAAYTLLDAPADEPKKARPVWVGYRNGTLPQAAEPERLFAALDWDSGRKKATIAFCQNNPHGAATVKVFRTATTPIGDTRPKFVAAEINAWPKPGERLANVALGLLPHPPGRLSSVTRLAVAAAGDRTEVTLTLDDPTLPPDVIRYSEVKGQWSRVVQTEEPLPPATGPRTTK